ncbi:acyl-CoA thioester hydrolase [Saccharothrix ecbatanensis]|uniref:Acyl-CoA thioester hydrolase n=1 Tax=Saccharothrix ecbatanensis TaxID=1105145 RepID=A0A7W9M1I9_9PSEU|nr:thioesterase family protein [Saccharothrix ecbatanensis]MBB5804029.1 acyl-CoA thioester hydrolase [Saccharothrix ecbatanensis]
MPFTSTTHVRWPDVDPNGHMRTTAYLDAAEDNRMQFFASAGFPVTELAARRIGPISHGDDIRYRAELRLLEAFTVELRLAGLASDGARFRLHNRIVKADNRTAATIVTTAGWLDLDARRLTTPPADLLAVLTALDRTKDFAELPSPLAHV